jgi:hypothetical protein
MHKWMYQGVASQVQIDKPDSHGGRLLGTAKESTSDAQ